MEILITTPIFPPETRGPATYTYNLSQKLKGKGQKCNVITFSHNPVMINGVGVYSIPIIGGTLFRQSRLFVKILDWGRKADVIYAQGADVVGLASCIAGKILGKPVVIKFVGDLAVEMERDFGRKIGYLSWATKLSLSLADRIIFPADHLRKTTIARYGIDPEKTAVIYNAV